MGRAWGKAAARSEATAERDADGVGAGIGFTNIAQNWDRYKVKLGHAIVAFYLLQLIAPATLAQGAEVATVKIELVRIIKQPKMASALVWSPDGQRLAEIHDFGREIGIWSRDGRLLTTIARGEGVGPYFGKALAFLDDGKLLPPSI